MHPAHPHLRCVGRAQQGRFLWNDLGQVGRSPAEAGCELAEGVDVGPQRLGHSDAAPVRAVQGQLQGVEESGRPRYGQGNEA